MNNSNYDAAIRLLRHKALVAISKGNDPCIGIEAINEVLIVAGVPVITPKEIYAPEVDVIAMEKEEEF